jgi:tetratricopeptide (TPR) repeat protein/TolB-like protein/tRNA A-37 threonylcarbamoyl transferase component Bud32
MRCGIMRPLSPRTTNMEERKPESPSGDDTADTGFPAGDEPTSPALSPPSPIPPGTPVTAVFQPTQLLAGRFKLIRFVARGGMGEVYEAQDEELNERVAVKTARFENTQTAHEIERFRREIQLARKVTHPNVCRTFDVFRHGVSSSGDSRSQILIVSMELLSGETLAQRIHDRGRLQITDALPLVEQMCAGLAAAHRAGVIHRDFKSSNVMLVKASADAAGGEQPQQEKVRAVITDFGLAHAEEVEGGTLTRLGDIVGTPAYMAPEQIDGGAITPATDIYALGVVIYEMLTGLLPFSADTPLATAMKRLNHVAPSLRLHIPDLDPRWEAVVARCLERSPDRRFTSTEDVVQALRGESVPTTAPSPGGAGGGESPSDSAAGATAGSIAATTRFERWRFPVVIAAIVFFLAAFGIFEFRRRAAEREVENAKQTAARQPAAGARKSIAVLGFQNLSGRKDADSLGDVLADSLWSQLDTGQVRFIPSSRVDEMKQNLGMGSLANALSSDQIAAIRKFLGTDILVTGSYTVTGAADHPGVQWNIHLLNAADGESLGSVAQSGSEADLNALVVHSGRLLRQQLGITLSAAEEARMDASLSSNADAMRYYSQAREKLRAFDVLAATKLLEKSIEADPQFAQAHSALAESWDALGFESKAAEEARKALDSVTGLSTEARARANGQYFAAMRDWNKAIQQYAQLWAEYRDEPEYGLLLANTQIRAGKAADALTTIAQVRSQTLPAGIRAQVDLAEAHAHGDLADYKQELTAATSAADTAKTLGANLLLARARILQCFAEVNLGDAEKARPLCEEAMKINLSAGDQLGAARATNDMANSYYYAGNYAAAEPLYREALSIAQTIGDAYDEAGALNNLANSQSAQGEHIAAEKTYEQAITVARERNELGDVALAQQNLAIELYATGDSKRAKQIFDAALQSAQNLGDKNLEARILNSKCATKLVAGALLDARKSCEDSLKIRREINDRADIGKTLANFGNVQLQQADLDGAHSSLRESLSALESVSAKNDAAYTRISLAQLALEQHKADDAAKYAADAATDLAAEKDPGGEAEARAMWAQALLASGNIAGAREQSDKATQLAQQSGDRGTKLDAAIAGALVDTKAGKAEAALRALTSAQKEARAGGMIQIEYDARLALGETQIASGHKSDGRATLRQLAQDAKARGFKLTAQKALAASQG